MKSWKWTLAAGACAMSMVACSTDEKAKPGGNDAGANGGSGAGGETGDSGPTAPPGLSLLWRIVESGAIGVAVDAGPGPANPGRVADLPGLAGEKVCVYEHPEIPCVTSDADGKFTLKGLPALTNLVITCEKKDYVKSLRAIETASTPMDNLSAPIVTGKSEGTRPDLGIEYDDTKGAVSFFALGVTPDGGLGLPLGVTVTLSPNSGDGPFFTRENNTFVTGAEGTSGGLGFFFNLEPGDYEITFHNTAADCAPISFPFGAWGYPKPPTTVKFPVLSGYVTDQVGVLCTPKE